MFIKIFQIFFSIVCSQSFLLKNFAMVRSLFLPSQWQASILSPEIFTSIWYRILQTVGSSWSCLTEEAMPTTSTHSWWGYYAFFLHWHSTEISCLTKASFTFFTTTISDSSFLKLRYISLNSSVRVFIVLPCRKHVQSFSKKYWTLCTWSLPNFSIFQFFWFLENNRAFSKFLYGVLHYFISTIKS